MTASSPLLTHQRRAQSVPPSPSISHDTLKKLVETSYFKRLVQLHVNLRCRQALKEGKIRLASPPNPIFLPRVDIVDDSSSPRIVATFELPGVRNDELTMHLHDGKLHIHGERRPRIPFRTNGDQADSEQPFNGASDEASLNDMAVDSPPRQIRIPTQELKYGKFQRNLDVPRNLKHTDVTARFQDGMLIVTWPRSSSDSDVTLPHNDSQDSQIISNVSVAKAEPAD